MPTPPSTPPGGSAGSPQPRAKPVPKVSVRRPAPATKAPNWLTRARGLLTAPQQEWAVIAVESATVGAIYRRFLLVAAAIGPAAATIGTIISGGESSSLSGTYTISAFDAVTRGVLEYGLNLGAIYLLGIVIAKVAANLGAQPQPVQAFKVAAYGATPYWLGGVLAVLPKLAPIGLLLGLYSCRQFSLGLSPVMKTPEGKVGVYTLITSVAGIILVLLISAVLQLVINS